MSAAGAVFTKNSILEVAPKQVACQKLQCLGLERDGSLFWVCCIDTSTRLVDVAEHEVINILLFSYLSSGFCSEVAARCCRPKLVPCGGVLKVCSSILPKSTWAVDTTADGSSRHIVERSTQRPQQLMRRYAAAAAA